MDSKRSAWPRPRLGAAQPPSQARRIEEERRQLQRLKEVQDRTCGGTATSSVLTRLCCRRRSASRRASEGRTWEESSPCLRTTSTRPMSQRCTILRFGSFELRCRRRRTSEPSGRRSRKSEREKDRGLWEGAPPFRFLLLLPRRRRRGPGARSSAALGRSKAKRSAVRSEPRPVGMTRGPRQLRHPSRTSQSLGVH